MTLREFKDIRGIETLVYYLTVYLFKALSLFAVLTGRFGICSVPALRDRDIRSICCGEAHTAVLAGVHRHARACTRTHTHAQREREIERLWNYLSIL